MSAPTALSVAIRRIIEEHGRLSTPVAGLSDADNLYGAGLTSHASVSLMLACEDEWDVEFPQHLLSKNTFASVDSIRSALVEMGVVE